MSRRRGGLLAKLKGTLQTVAIILSIQGLVTFSLFIFEESLQVTTFGTWPAQDAGDWNLVLDGIDLMEKINFGMKVINYGVGWIQPLAFFSYKAYSKSTDFYISGLKAKAFARAPHVFEGRIVDFTFEPQRIERQNESIWYINRNITVITNEDFPLQTLLKVRGTVVVKGKTIYIEDSKVEKYEPSLIKKFAKHMAS